jgi:hypothetical protein
MIGEAGKEAVIPIENTSFIDSLASSIGSVVLNAMQFSNKPNTQQSNLQAILNIDGAQIARALIPLLNKEESRIGTTAIIQAT